MHRQYKLFESKLKLIQASNHCKRVLEAAKFAHGNKITWLLALLANCYGVIRKGKSTIYPLFHSPELLCSPSNRKKLFAKNLSKNSDLDNLGISLPVFL